MTVVRMMMTIITVIEDMEDVIQEVTQELDDKVNILSMLCLEAIFKCFFSFAFDNSVSSVDYFSSHINRSKVLPSLTIQLF